MASIPAQACSCFRHSPFEIEEVESKSGILPTSVSPCIDPQDQEQTISDFLAACGNRGRSEGLSEHMPNLPKQHSIALKPVVLQLASFVILHVIVPSSQMAALLDTTLLVEECLLQ